MTKEEKRKYNAKYRITHRKERLAYGAKYYADHREERLKYGEKYYDANKESVRKKVDKYQNTNREKINKSAKKYRTTPVGRWVVFRKKAKERGLSISITKSEFLTLTGTLCFYCGQFSNGKTYTGVDRTDSSKGYVRGNCVPCCTTCNWMKSDLTVTEWFDHMEKIQKWSV